MDNENLDCGEQWHQMGGDLLTGDSVRQLKQQLAFHILQLCVIDDDAMREP